MTRPALSSISLLSLVLLLSNTRAFFHCPVASRASLTRLSFFGGSRQPHGQERGPPTASALPGTTLVLEHPSTGSQVYIVGCVHGSEASEEDVSTVFRLHSPAAVVLELCPARFEGMQAEEAKYLAALQAAERRHVAKTETRGTTPQSTRGGSGGVKASPSSHPVDAWGEASRTLGRLREGLTEVGSNLQTFSKQHGLMQTLLIALLSSSAEVQRVLSSCSSRAAGLPRRRRGSCEFRTSVELAQAAKATVVLGDQDLVVTLGRFKQGIWPGGGPRLEEVRAGQGEREERPRNIGRRAVMELTSFRDALLGPADLPRTCRVDVLRLLFTEERYLREVATVLVPVGLVVLGALRAMEAAGDTVLASAAQILPSSLTSLGELAPSIPLFSAGVGVGAGVGPEGVLGADVLANIGWAALNAFMLCYFVAINRYILVERDAFLADSIARAAATKETKGRVVAAVVGLLHGNGIARHLRERHGFVLRDRP
ncbi:hypothetical protein NSK_005005 [Nannochloropsis salina CCMP1776]|uniref:Uncharacterized protein n=1 Tax=Nannochloropsis salina CCMP1776 TaxID=1027361 RepID=A0A4D9D5I5_9STRA|nr:hypothetical protein NSK_005005 [Nannochloropsis salina CCMP1776]|eukprot:TFJ83908.1 hypothetical protein NSK_005005 [Nannochloropsis salina CCMP1776]